MPAETVVMDAQLVAAAVQAPLTAATAWMIYALRRSLPPGMPPPPGEPAQAPPPPPHASPAGGTRPAPHHAAWCGGAGPDAATGAALERVREDVAAFKLEVARTYVPLSLIRDVDARLTAHLLRIESKLDEAARSAAVATARVAALEDDR